MTFVELYGTALDRELGTDDRVLFTLTRRKAAVNDAVKEFCRLTSCLTREGTLSLSDGTAEYDLETITGTDFYDLTAQGPEISKVDASANTVVYAGDDLPRTTIARLNRENPGWRQADDGTPTNWYLRADGGATYLGLSPAPAIAAGETWTLRVPYLAVPTDMTADADEPCSVSANAKITLRPYHQGIVHLAASLLEKFRRDQAASQLQRQMGLEFAADFLKAQKPKGGRRIQYARNYRGESGSTDVPESSRNTTTTSWIGGSWIGGNSR